MDERQLSELFRSAPGEPPPSSFDSDDVAAASRKVTARRRMAAGGVAAAVVLLVGGGLATGAVLGGSDDPDRMPPVAERAPSSDGAIEPRTAQPADTPERQSESVEPPVEPTTAPEPQVLPESEPKQGGEGTGERTYGCGEVDRELAAALAGELSVDAGEASPGEYCPDGGTSVAFRVDGSALTAVHAPAGVSVAAPSGNVQTAERGTAGGGTLMVVNEPLTRMAVEGPDVDRLADRIAPGL
ncbi:hypothetical protein BJF85_08180 [Saccharomonospora sp. CUA-673]|uniref:hypothetical protein n=1 Tax=Saccharomonospora sp. CUA-673 TaxID=1904969 RepID=UPI000966806E|nr:hypothetical protein [Saccharomonospora sp. CUA-673]OLT38677.1 hypothetical protein BJF85_08180 [Saccharomonospora sp. CUA-673]